MWLTFLIVIVVDWSGASVTPRGLSVQDETLERAVRVKRLIGRPLESTLAERKSTTSYGEEPNKITKRPWSYTRVLNYIISLKSSYPL